MRRPGAFYGGLFITALVILILEILQTRLLSVLTWYHLAFLAISLAMLGMTAGALYIYLESRFSSRRDAGGRQADVLASLARFSLYFSLSAPLAHLTLLVLRVPTDVGREPMAIWALCAVSLVAAIPFFFAGVVIALALTRVELPIGRIYGADLLGAGSGCLLAVPLMNRLDPTSAVFLLSALAAAGGLCFHLAAGRRLREAGAIAALVSMVLGFSLTVLNASRYPDLFQVAVMKGRPVPQPLVVDRWNSHSRVTGRESRSGAPTLWGAGAVPLRETVQVRQLPLRIDGGAFTVATGFDGDPDALGWLRHDLTSLAFHLRGRGDVAVVGVGGGRDLLTALAFGAERVTGIEINDILLDLLAGQLRSFTGLAERPNVRLVHAEGRGYLSANAERYDLIQMALVDTWASTAAGAMTLTENGLYTVEAWRLFLQRLEPDGILAVSRWYARDRPGETARLLSLAVGVLIAEGVSRPEEHLVMMGSGNLGNLLVRRSPFTSGELETLAAVARNRGFETLVSPASPSPDPLLRRIVAARDAVQLAEATRHPYLDLSPPTDDRPFFFNMLRPGAWLSRERLEREVGGVLEGNLRATETLTAILAVVSVLVLLTVIGPLSLLGRPATLSPSRFAAAAAYFSLIGLGFMLVEIALIQRFSILLGHPVYSLAITLMSIIVATGIGSLLSDRLGLDTRARALLVPTGIAGVVVAVTLALAPLARLAEGASPALRVGAVLVLTLPLGLVLGFAFPVGLRLVRRGSPRVLSWMWGLNGAFGVLGSVVAVLLSMAWGIGTCMMVGALCYLLLLLPTLFLWQDRIGERVIQP